MTFDTGIKRLPESIRKAWGDDVAVEFTNWLTAILRDRSRALAIDSPHVQVAPAYARRRVNGLMLDRVSHLLLAGEPRLIWVQLLLVTTAELLPFCIASMYKNYLTAVI